jgi:hypothetical protein
MLNFMRVLSPNDFFEQVAASIRPKDDPFKQIRLVFSRVTGRYQARDQIG